MSNHPVESGPIDPTNPKFLKPYIDGIEVTQGIQYYKADQHLTDPNDRNKDNSVILVANKPAWVRVYVHDLSSSGRSVTGELEVDRNWQFPPKWEQEIIKPLAPSTIPTLENFDYVTERSNILATLNFVIPQNLMSYNLRLRAKIWSQEDGDRNNPDDIQSAFLNIMIRQTLRLRGIMISYSGLDPNSPITPPPTINLDAPTISDLQSTAAYTLTTNPVQSQGAISSAGSMEWTTPLTGPAIGDGGCSQEWTDLTVALAEVKTNDGNRTDVIYYGLLPRDTPVFPVTGCALNGVIVARDDDQVAMAHEVGHAAGLQHAPCGVTVFDTKYPAYEPYDPTNMPTASLGEYGLDINNGNIHLPTAKDYMSYCFQEWISLYHQARLTNNTVFDPQQLKLSKADIPGLVDPYIWPWEENPPWWETVHGGAKIRPQKIISIIGIYNKERQIKVQSVMRMYALPIVSDAIETNFVANLVGSGGEILAQAPIMRLKSHGHGCGCCNDEENSRNYKGPFAFQALVSDVEPGSALSIVKRNLDDNEEGTDKEVWSRSAPEQSSKITNFYVDLSGEKGVAEWDGEFSSPYGVKFSLQFSKDEGRSWNSLAVGVDKNRYEFDLKVIPVGQVVFRLLAHDGFFTNQRDSEYLEIRNYEPVVSILHPQASSKLVSGMPMRLWAAVNTSTIPNLKINKYVWKIDGEELGQDIGQDIETWITAPSPGNHVCEITVVDENFNSIVVTTQFTTID